jgi:hypothetical protein
MYKKVLKKEGKIDDVVELWRKENLKEEEEEIERS